MTAQKILVVEDERLLNEAYETILESNGYDVEVAFDGDEAIQKTRSFKPDLILLDLRMPRMSGTQFLKAYNVKKTHPTVKVVVFSNLDNRKEIDEAFKLGANRYILKAWSTPRDLIKLVKEMLDLPQGAITAKA
jgi:two-component system response regulator VicR